MLNIFFVNQGEILVMELDNALRKVVNLKQHVAELISIPAEKQIMLLRDGTLLSKEDDVFYHNAGSENNPIFLYVKSSFEAAKKVPLPACYDLTEKAQCALALSDTYELVEVTTKLAKKMCEYAKDMLECNGEGCTAQCLQNIGWNANVKNLERIFRDCKSNYETLKQNLIANENAKAENLAIITSVEEVFDTLENIPVPNFVVEFLTNKDSAAPSPPVMYTNLCEVLFDEYWHSQIMEECNSGLQLIKNIPTSESIINMDKQLKEIELNVNTSEFKVIAGIQGRLKTLTKAHEECKQLTKNLTATCEIFEANYQRIQITNHPSVYSTICTSHKEELRQMKADYSKLHNLRSRNISSKYELVSNINNRMGWVNTMNTKIRDFNSDVLFWSIQTARLKDTLRKLEKVAKTPLLYFKTIAEVVRRTVYRENYKKWAYKLHADCREAYDKETSLRNSFIPEFCQGIISSRIPITDNPSTYACEPAPDERDGEIPTISDTDMEIILKLCPAELKHLFVVDEHYGIPQVLLLGLHQEEAQKNTPNTSGTEGSFASAAAYLEPYDTESEDFEEIPQLMEQTVKYVNQCYQHVSSDGNDEDDTAVSIADETDKSQQTDLEEETISMETFEKWKREYMEEQEVIISNLKEKLEEKTTSEHNLEESLRNATELATEEKENNRLLIKEHELELDTYRQQHRLEMEGLRSRFKMMTTNISLMDKPPSETSVEKFDQEYIESMRKGMEQEFALKLKDKLRDEEKRQEQIERAQAEQHNEQLTLKSINDDKSRVIEDLHLRVSLLTDEVEEMQILKKKLNILEDKLIFYEREVTFMNTQLHKYNKKSDKSPVPDEPLAIGLGNLHFPHMMLYACFSNISIYSSEKQNVLVFAWDNRYNHYRAVIDEGLGLHFLHKSCHASLGILEDCPNKHPCLGKIYKKERCKLKKEVNRFGMPINTEFYRVKACHPKDVPPMLEKKDKRRDSIRDRKVSREPVFAEIPELEGKDKLADGQSPGTPETALRSLPSPTTADDSTFVGEGIGLPIASSTTLSIDQDEDISVAGEISTPVSVAALIDQEKYHSEGVSDTSDM